MFLNFRLALHNKRCKRNTAAAKALTPKLEAFVNNVQHFCGDEVANGNMLELMAYAMINNKIKIKDLNVKYWIFLKNGTYSLVKKL